MRRRGAKTADFGGPPMGAFNEVRLCEQSHQSIYGYFLGFSKTALFHTPRRMPLQDPRQLCFIRPQKDEVESIDFPKKVPLETIPTPPLNVIFTAAESIHDSFRQAVAKGDSSYAQTK